jgi:hypothetical protein
MLTAMPPPPEIATALDRGERVIWSGQPRRGLTLRSSDAFAIPFSLIWCGFAIFWEWNVTHTAKAPAFMVLWGIPFVLIGLYLVFARFFVDAAQRRSTYYALTNERILIISGLWSRNIKSLPLRTLEQVDLSTRASGEGTISFGRAAVGSRGFTPAGWPGSAKYLPPMFEMIQDAAQVANLVRSAQRALR